MRLSKCVEALRTVGVTSKAGRTAGETAAGLCLAAQDHVAYDKATGITPNLIGKMFSTRWSGLEKSVDGGINHFVSVDNGAYYAELWSQGENYYAVTGAKEDKQAGGIWEIPGVYKGMNIRKAVPLFLKALDEGRLGGIRKRQRRGCTSC